MDSLNYNKMNIIDSVLYRKQVDALAQTITENSISILITGATGLIGSCLVDVFMSASCRFGKNIKVIALARNEEELKRRFHYANDDSISLISHDITNQLEIDFPIDYIIHAASYADPVAYSLFPVETILTNVYGTNNVLSYCKQHKNIRLLLMSTFEVYGKIELQDIYKENDSGEIDLNAIRSCYPESKRCAEILMRCYKQEYDIDFVIARLSSVYGPTMTSTDSKAHAQFIRNALSGEKIKLKSKGEQKRSYSYLMDVVSGIIMILFRGKSGEAYNVANEEGVVSIAEVAKCIAEICDTDVEFSFPSEIEQRGFSRVQNCILDNKKLKNLGWKEHYSLYEGLSSTIKILKELSLR